MGKQWKPWQILFSWAQKSLQMVTVAMRLRCLLLGRKAMTNLDRILKRWHIILPIKVWIVKAMVFPVVMYGCECSIINNAKNWYFWIVVLEKTLENPLESKEIKLVNPKGIQYSLEGLMLKLRFQSFGHLMQIGDSLEKTLILGKIEGSRESGDKGWDGWMAS